MALKTTYDDSNLVVDEALTVPFSTTIIQGNWSYTSANVSGWYNAMRECHRYARKRFRYFGMTYSAAKKCRDDMVKLFMRKIMTSYWNSTAMGGGWTRSDGGQVPMADVSLVHNPDDSWDVNVNVNEDDVIYKMANLLFNPHDFTLENKRTYGSDANGNLAETFDVPPLVKTEP